MVWVVDKKVVRHLLETDNELVEIPIRVKFEFELDRGSFVPDTLKVETLYNKAFVCRRFPDIDDAWLDVEVRRTVDQAIDEHLRMEGYMSSRPSGEGDPDSGTDA